MTTKHPSWLPTEAQMQVAIAMQRAYNQRQGSRVDGPDSVYVGPGIVRQPQQTKPAPWWRRLLGWLRG